MSGAIEQGLRVGASLARDLTRADAVERALASAAPAVAKAGERFDVDVLVGGAGPGGGMAAAIAAKLGAKVLVAEARPFPVHGLGAALDGSRGEWGQRWQHVIVRPASMDDMRAAGIWESLFETPGTLYMDGSARQSGIAVVGDVEQRLAQSAQANGAEFVFGTVVEDAVPMHGGGMLVSLSGHDAPIRARTYIDATGGRAAFLDRYGIGLGAERESSGTYFLGQYPRQVPRGGIPPRGSETRYAATTDHGRSTVVILDHPTYGAHVDIRPGRPITTTDSKELARIHRGIAHAAGVSGEPLSPPYLVHVVEREAEHAVGRTADGQLIDVVVVGDGLARKQARAAQGFNGAIDDGRAAAEAAMLEGPDRASALEAYERTHLDFHRGHMHSHSYAEEQARLRREQMERDQAAFLENMRRKVAARG